MNKGVLLVLGTAVISGISIFLNAFAVKGMSADLFTFTKNIIVAVALVSIILISGNWAHVRKLTAKEWRLLTLIGFVGGSVPFILFYRGLQLSTASTGSFLQKIQFVFVAVIAAMWLREDVKKYLLPGGLILLGNILLLGFSGFSFGLGEVLILAATILWSIENVLSKSATKRISGTLVAAARMGFGAVFLFAWLVLSGQTGGILTWNPAQLEWIIITALFLLGYVLMWYNGIKYIPISLATMLLQLGAPITIILNYLMLGKSVLVVQVVGCILIGAATLWMVSRVRAPMSQRT